MEVLLNMNDVKSFHIGNVRREGLSITVRALSLNCMSKHVGAGENGYVFV